MNNYKITLYRNIRERFDCAIEAHSAQEALEEANNIVNLSRGPEWEEDGVSEVIDYEVVIAR